MVKKQLGARVDAEIAELAAKRAADRGLGIGEYLESLVLEDTKGLRDRAMGAAERFLAEHQALFDEAEAAATAPAGKAGDGAGARAA
ncbi:hypothetical protein [Streptomyces sp. NPDC096193]|uniref:hypothetical protein n=1 Tax=Streptomyces sp. NPDC096193 TaxID=3155821 RepID=UPI00332B3B21